MISRWLEKLGLVERVPKTVTVEVGGREYSHVLNQSYMLTASGRTALGRATGRSRHRRIPKNVCYEMMATNGADREYLRTRRSLILKHISETPGRISYDDIVERLLSASIRTNVETVRDDIRGLINIGLDIDAFDACCEWRDLINDFCIPVTDAPVEIGETIIKDRLRPKLTAIPHSYLALVDLAFDGSQSLMFEILTIDLLREECGYCGIHLGGSRRPDGVAYTANIDGGYGVIIDTKAYSCGYRLPIAHSDEMRRYIQENQTRDITINPNMWWKHFGEGIDEYFFMFVSGRFIGNTTEKLNLIRNFTQTDGTAINVENLLLLANAVKEGRESLDRLKTTVFNNSEYVYE